MQVQNHATVAEMTFHPIVFEQNRFLRPVSVTLPSSVVSQARMLQATRRKRDNVQQNLRSTFIFYKDGSFFRTEENVSYVSKCFVNLHQICSNWA